MDVFRAQRAAVLGLRGRALDVEVPGWRKHAKETAVWNIDQSKTLSATDLLNAELRRTSLNRVAARFFERHDALLLPAAQVPPFPVETEWVRTINGVALKSYLDWMSICCVVTVLGLPAISVPGDFTPEGLPVGVQIVGPPRDDLGVLRIAHAFEEATRFGQRRPALAMEQRE
jgi:amidase